MQKSKTNYSFRIDYNFFEKLPQKGEYPEPDDLLTSICGYIKVNDLDGDNFDLDAGYLEMYFLDSERAREFNTPVYSVCDASDGDLEGHAEAGLR